VEVFASTEDGAGQDASDYGLNYNMQYSHFIILVLPSTTVTSPLQCTKQTITCSRHINVPDSFDDEIQLTVLLSLHVIFNHL
jgi:hypothetical protein